MRPRVPAGCLFVCLLVGFCKLFAFCGFVYVVEHTSDKAYYVAEHTSDGGLSRRGAYAGWGRNRQCIGDGRITSLKQRAEKHKCMRRCWCPFL